MVFEMESSQRKKAHNMLVRAMKAAAKGIIIYVIYFVLIQFLAPISQLIPGFQQMIETFIIVYIVFVIMAELTSGSILQHFLNGAKALFVIVYLMFSLNSGVFSFNVENISLVADIHLFLTIAIVLELLILAKSMLQAINYMNERTEVAII
jgi:hypothetical protein